MPTYCLSVGPEGEGRSVRQLALVEMRLSGGQLKRAKFHGRILVDGADAMANQRLHAGQELSLWIPEEDNPPPVPYSLPLSVAFEDDCFLMIDKPAPLPSASSPKQELPTLENAVYAYLGRPSPFVYRPVNRLDKGTSGLMLVAKTAHAQHLLQQQLHTDSFLREYLAVVQGQLPQREGVIDLPIGKAEGATVRRQVRPDGKPARTFYRVLTEQNGRSLVRLKLDTGRTHQIRVHLSALGCPVTGDFLYGQEISQLPGRFALHSARCRVRHPLTGEWIDRESPLPASLAALLETNVDD